MYNPNQEEMLMKPKEFYKKLILNKRTIAHLDRNEMKEAHGGFTVPNPKCQVEATRSCPTNDSNDLACCCGGDTTLDIC